MQLPSMPLGRFPASRLRMGTTLYRCHGPRGPWFFSDRGTGRFDLDPPRGTCSVALDRATAVREVLRHDLRGDAVPFDAVRDRWVSRLAAPSDVRLANTASPRAQEFGVTNAIGGADGSVPGTYEVTRAWAGAFAAAGFDGVRYRSFFTSGDGAIALFGSAGGRETAGGRPARGWPIDRDAQRLQDVCGAADVGIRVLGAPPPSSALSVPAVPHFPRRPAARPGR